MILVCVQDSDQIAPARAFVAALSPRRQAFLLFLRPGLRERYGAPTHASSDDARICLLNPQNFEAVVSFSSRCEPASMPTLLVLDYFAELGIATIDVQRTAEVEAPGGVENQFGLALGNAARHQLSWTGERGIGFPSLPGGDDVESLFVPGFVLIAADLHRLPPSSRARYALALALLALVAAEPAEAFVWSVHPDEDDDARRLRELITAYDLPNLTITREIAAEDLAPCCALAIAPSPSLLPHLSFHRKPVLMFADAALWPAGESHVRRFGHGGELTRAFRALRISPANFVPAATMHALRPAVLHAELDRICALHTRVPHSLRGALPYLHALEREARPPARDDLEGITTLLARVTEKLTALHRSTLAYKAKRLAKRLGLPVP